MALPAGVRNFSYAEDKRAFRTRTQRFLLAAVLLALLFSPVWLSNYWLGMVSLIGIVIIAATGLNMITGYSGQLSFGHAGFIAVGAYASAIITGKFHQPFLAGLIGAGLIAGLAGALVGLPSSKVKGWLLALITIAAQLIILLIINLWSGMTGGSAGLIVSAPSIGAWDLSSATSQYFLIVIIMIITLFFANNLVKTKTGRAFISIRDNERAAQAMGINLFRNKLLAFFIGCAMAGTAGALMAHWTGFVNIGIRSLPDSIFYVGILVIGGSGTMVGPILGAIIYVLLTHQLATAIEGTQLLPTGVTSDIAAIIFASVILLFVVLMPRGLVKGFGRKRGMF